jgi:uncharacterized membrane protein YeaQ/YmgE (transglycosylase-associated protein family)
MHLAAIEPQTVLVVLVIGLVSGWLASLIVGGGGLVRDLVTGLIGSVVGGLILQGFGIVLPIASPLVADIAMSTLGAVVVVVLARIIV